VQPVFGGLHDRALGLHQQAGLKRPYVSPYPGIAARSRHVHVIAAQESAHVRTGAKSATACRVRRI
jgi:hypothetical protein